MSDVATVMMKTSVPAICSIHAQPQKIVVLEIVSLVQDQDSGLALILGFKMTQKVGPQNSHLRSTPPLMPVTPIPMQMPTITGRR